MGIVSRCYDVYFGQTRPRIFNRNKVNNSERWLGEVRIIEVEFKLVNVRELRKFENALEFFLLSWGYII
jgi:hypothetical protein